MCDEERYQVKYFILMLKPFKKSLICYMENVSYAKLERELEKTLLTLFSECKSRYPRSTLIINFEIAKKKGNFYQPKSMPVEVCH